MISVHTAAIIGVEDRKRGVLAVSSKLSNMLFLEQWNCATPNVIKSHENPQIYAALVWNFRRWAIVLWLNLSALWTFQVIHTDLDRQCIHSWRISQCYINIARNTFTSKTSRGWNRPGVRIKGNKPKGKIIWLKTISWESNLDHEYGRYMNSKLYLRKISHNYTCCFWLSALLLATSFFFVSSEQGYSSHDICDISSSLDLSKTTLYGD